MLDLAGRQPVIYCDFDGTVTTTDVTDVLLEKLAHPRWQEIEERWVKGEIDDCQCMAQQIALIHGNWQDIVQVLDTIKIDPYFKSFIALCKKASLPIYIGSNGIDRVISHILNRENIQVEGTWSYHLIESGQGWSLQFPQCDGRDFCHVPHSVACKCALLDKHKSAGKIGNVEPYRIVIGDSKSDFCWSNKADLVFGKAKLAGYCVERELNHLPFVDFSQINSELTNSGIFF